MSAGMTQLASRTPVDIYVMATPGGLDRTVAEVVLTGPRGGLAECYAPQVAAGGRCAAAAIEGRPIPPSPRSGSGERSVVTPTSGDLAAVGAIMQIG